MILFSNSIAFAISIGTCGQLLVIAYAAVLTLLAAYVGRIAMMQRASATEIARLEKLLATRPADATAAKKD